MTTPILQIDEITVSQASKYATANTAFRELEAAICGLLTHDMTSDADYTLTTTGSPEQWHYGTIAITDTSVWLTTGRNIIIPASREAYARTWTFSNQTAQTLTLKTASGTGIAVATNKTAILRCDGTNVVRVTADT